MTRYILNIFCICFSLIASSQSINSNSSIIRDNMFAINPARTGSFYHFSGDRYRASELTANFSNYWSGYQTSNTTLFASFHTAIGSDTASLPKFGLGVNLVNDRSHVLSKTGVVLSYAYNINMMDKVRWSFGLNASYLNQNVRTENAIIKHPDDPALQNGLWNGNYFNVGTGLNVHFHDKSEKNSLSFDFAANNLLNALYQKQEGNYLTETQGGIPPSLLIGLDYTLTIDKGNQVVEIKQKELENNKEKGFDLMYKSDSVKAEEIKKISNSDLSPEQQLAKRDSLNLAFSQALSSFNENYEDKESALKEISGLKYGFNPFFVSVQDVSSAWEFHLGIRHYLKFKGMPFKLLFGNSFQVQSQMADDLGGRMFTLNSFIGGRVNDHLTVIVDLDNNINTYNRNNDVFRIGTTIKYNIFK